MAVPEIHHRVKRSTGAAARLLDEGLRDELLAVLREIAGHTAAAERLAYSPEEAAELLGISRELVHDLLRSGQLGSVKAGRRRLIGRQHLDAFLSAGQPGT
jgi:excisionase family DNA binding protein